MRTIRKPGKFEGETALALFAYDVDMNGFADDFAGKYSRIAGPFTVEEVREAVESADPENYYGLLPFTPEEEEEIRETVGAILYERDCGFVDCETFTDTEAFGEAWAEVEEEEASYSEEER